MFWLNLSWRNLLRNKRRAFFTISAMALAYAAINLLSGFMLYVFRGLEDTYVYAFEGGHLTVSKPMPKDRDPLEDGPVFITAEELDLVQAAIENMPGVLKVTPRISLVGMLSNGERSTIMMAQGKVAADGRFIRQQGRGIMRELQLYEGQDLADSGEYEIAIAHGLADRLGLGIDGQAITMANTLEGYMNALDAQVVQLQDAPLEVLDEMLATLPLEYAQQLLDTDGVESLVVLIEDGKVLEAKQAELETLLAEAGFSLQVENWKDLRVSYHRIRNMFQVIFSFVFLIVLMIVILSVINTVTMAVMERTREIGTLRAIGLNRNGVIRLFTIESMLMALLGSAVGAAIYGAVWWAVQLVRPSWIPPNIPKRVPWEISFAPTVLLSSFLVLIALAALAAWLPSRRAGQMSIPEALTHN
ncbi:MAG: ABC transporter permease [Opitutales bacterium]